MAKNCVNCGAVMEDDRRFCTQCGAPAGAAPKTPVYQTAPPPVYGGDAPPPPGSRYEPISTRGYIGIMLLMCIPVAGQILMLIWALGGCKKINKRNLARASLVMTIVALVLGLLLGMAAKALVGKMVDAVEQETGISLSGQTGGGQSEGQGGLLDSLGGLLGGGSGNSDLDKLGELGTLLEGLEGLTGEGGDLSGLIDSVEDINAQAEAQNSGWPKSLRKYPSGTAAAVASYRTEISGTTAEEMMDWIAALKQDGFQYQDFYDFGMTEADMLSVNGWWATDGEIYLSLSYSDGKVIVDHMDQLPDMSGLLG